MWHVVLVSRISHLPNPIYLWWLTVKLAHPNLDVLKLFGRDPHAKLVELVNAQLSLPIANTRKHWELCNEYDDASNKLVCVTLTMLQSF